MTYQQIVDECNELAALFYGAQGYTSPKGYRFDQATHPQELSMWRLAVIAYEHIDGTDVEQALVAIEEG